MMRSCGEAGRERNVRRVNKFLVCLVTKGAASSRRVDARWVGRKTGRLNRSRGGIGNEKRNFTKDGLRVHLGISFAKPAAVIVDPNADGNKRPSALDNQIKVIPDAVDIASDDQQSAFLGRKFAGTRRASFGGTNYNSISKALRRPTLGLDFNYFEAGAAVNIGEGAAWDG